MACFIRILWIVIVLAAVGGNVRNASAATRHPIELFTRSLSSFYIILKQCSTLTNNANQDDINTIVKYLGTLYPGGVPYWALPSVTTQIHDEDTCSYLMYDRAISYRLARDHYRKNYPKEPVPPRFVVTQPANYYYLERVLFGDHKKKDTLELDW